MKVLICGVSGLVGHDLSLLLSENSIKWVGTHNLNPHDNSVYVDFFDISKLRSFFDEIAPDVCINCIAERNVDKCENSWIDVQKVNIAIPEILSNICKEKHIHFIHISTDYVFDGSNSPYLPSSPVNPIQSYGISKLIAELRIQTKNEDTCIIRVPVLYTNTSKRFTDTAVTLIGKKVLDQICNTTEDNYHIRRPVFIADLCIFILNCIKNKSKGLYHFYNPKTKETKYSMLKKIAFYLDKPITHVKPISTPPTQPAGRPYDTEMKDLSFDISNYRHTSIEDGIKECFSSIYHSPIYKNKKNQDIFLLLDLDGTLTDTDTVHYNCYKIALSEYNISINREQYDSLVSIDKFILDNVSQDDYLLIKQRKNSLLYLSKTIELMPGASELINYIVKFKINHAVVTNTSKINVEFFKEKQPILKNLNIVSREDYVAAKPEPDSYIYAKDLYYKGEKYIIGIENTINGYLSLQNITKCIYILTDYNSYYYNILKKENVYLINTLSSIFANVQI